MYNSQNQTHTHAHTHTNVHTKCLSACQLSKLVTAGGLCFSVCRCHGSFTRNYGLRMRRECRERFPRHHGLAIPTCVTARARRTCRDACRDHLLAVSFKVIHSRRMRNLQLCTSGKRPITCVILWKCSQDESVVNKVWQPLMNSRLSHSRANRPKK